MDYRVGVAAAAQERLSVGQWALIWVISYFLILKVVFAGGAFPVADETYYWMWGRHPELSYYDHPPLQGWLQGLSYTVFGRSLFALRWMTFAALGCNLGIFYLIARRLGGADWLDIFLRSTATYLASPLYGFFGSVAFHDYLLVTLLLGSGYLFIGHFSDIETRGRGRLRDLFVAAALLGLAALTKYNGAFLGLAVAGAVLVRPKLRRLLLSWELWVAAAIALGLQTPVLIWNAENHFASLGFQLGSRHGDTGFQGISIQGMKGFAGEALLLVSPFIIPVIGRLFLASPRSNFEQVGKTLAIWLFWISSLACLYVSNYSWVLWWWNIAALVLVFPFAGKYQSPVLLGLHIFWGALVSTFMTMTYAFISPLLLLGMAPGMETESAYGWDEITRAVVTARLESGADFLAANRYQTASQLGFVLDDPDTVSLSAQHDGFDDWQDRSVLRGQRAVVLVDPSADAESWKAHFTKIRSLGPIDAARYGHVVRTYELYLAENFDGRPDPATSP